MKFLAQKTDGGGKKGKIALYCRVLQVSRQGFYRHLSRRERPWKYQGLAEAMREIHDEDVCNDTYGRVRMRQALLLKQPEGVTIPSERTVYRVMKEIGLVHHPKRKPNGITKKDGKLYVSAIFDCFDLTVLGLAMDDNMKAELCVRTLDSAAAAYPGLRGAIVHSDRGSQYTSGAYRAAVEKYGIRQSMNSDGGRCHDNARCESMWARMKTELFYGRIEPESMTVEQLKTLVWRYFISYWNRRRICSANDGLPPALKRQRFFAALDAAA